MPGAINWSTDPSSNDVSDPPILWTEGQPANTNNNSARAMMASWANWRDDNAGALQAVRGAGDAYTLATGQVFSAAVAAKAHTIAFTVNTVNQGPVTLSLDGQTPRPVYRSYASRVLAPGDFSPAILFRLAYVPGLAGYVVVSPAIARPGTIAMHVNANPDPGWLLCNGQLLSRAPYAALYAEIGQVYGPSDGTTNFSLPNFNGRAPFGLDNTGAVLTGAGGLTGGLGSAGGAERVTLSAAQMPSHTHGGGTTAAGGHDHGGAVAAAGSHAHGGTTGAAGNHSHAASADSQGGHSHTGTTNTGGSHAHSASYSTTAVASGTSATAAYSVSGPGLPLGVTTSTAGDHNHGFTTDPAGAHTHGVTIAAVGDHAHAIAADGTHAHAITAVGDHAHGLTINPAGGDGAHANIPPGLVVAFVIKA